MKRLALASAILSCLATAALAQQPAPAPAAPAPAAGAVAANTCEPKPTYPGLKSLKSDVEVKAFEGQIKSYKECIMAFISERRAAADANNKAANAAAEEHNRVMDKIRADQDAARQEAEKAQSSERAKPDLGTQKRGY